MKKAKIENRSEVVVELTTKEHKGIHWGDGNKSLNLYGDCDAYYPKIYISKPC